MPWTSNQLITRGLINLPQNNAFGDAVSIDGDRVAVTDPVNSRIYLFNLDKLKNKVTTFITFSHQVTMLPTSSICLANDHLVVGSCDPTNTTSLNGNVVIYKYNKTSDSWDNVKFLPSVTPGDNFGTSVYVDKNLLVIGANRGNSSQQVPISGVCYVLYYINAENKWSEPVPFSSEEANGREGFGTSVSISGNNIVVGAPGLITNITRDRNARINTFVYFFNYDFSSNIIKQKNKWPNNTSSPPGRINLGGDVSLSGDKVSTSSYNTWAGTAGNLLPSYFYYLTASKNLNSEVMDIVKSSPPNDINNGTGGGWGFARSVFAEGDRYYYTEDIDNPDGTSDAVVNIGNYKTGGPMGHVIIDPNPSNFVNANGLKLSFYNDRGVAGFGSFVQRGQNGTSSYKVYLLQYTKS